MQTLEKEINKTETESWVQRLNKWLPEEGRREIGKGDSEVEPPATK